MLFWHDRWCSDHPLKEIFSAFFGCFLNQDDSVASVLDSQRPGSPREWIRLWLFSLLFIHIFLGVKKQINCDGV